MLLLRSICIMTIIQMKYFYEVCRWQNITKAAEYLHVSQPTVSVAMQTLEAETGLNLFRRNGKKLFVSKDGNTLLTKIRPLLEELDQLQHTINDMSHRRNHIRIALPPQVGSYVIPFLLGDFRQTHSEIILEIIEISTADSLQLLKNETIDMAIINYTHNSNDFSYHHLATSECCFYTYTGHPLTKRTSISINALKNEPLAMLDTSFNITHLIYREFAKENLQMKIIHYSPHLFTIKSLVQHKIASTFLMRHAVSPGDNLIPLSLAKPLYLETAIVTKRNRQIYADERLIINFIKNLFNNTTIHVNN